MIGRPSRKQNLQRKKSSGGCKAAKPMTDDSEPIALRVTLVGRKRHSDNYQVVWLAHFCI
jgi:hypothetical protein